MGRLDTFEGFGGLREWFARIECTGGSKAGDEEGMESTLEASVIIERGYADEARNNFLWDILEVCGIDITK